MTNEQTLREAMQLELLRDKADYWLDKSERLQLDSNRAYDKFEEYDAEVRALLLESPDGVTAPNVID